MENIIIEIKYCLSNTTTENIDRLCKRLEAFSSTAATSCELKKKSESMTDTHLMDCVNIIMDAPDETKVIIRNLIYNPARIHQLHFGPEWEDHELFDNKDHAMQELKHWTDPEFTPRVVEYASSWMNSHTSMRKMWCYHYMYDADAVTKTWIAN